MCKPVQQLDISVECDRCWRGRSCFAVKAGGGGAGVAKGQGRGPEGMG